MVFKTRQIRWQPVIVSTLLIANTAAILALPVWNWPAEETRACYLVGLAIALLLMLPVARLRMCPDRDGDQRIRHCPVCDHRLWRTGKYCPECGSLV